MNLSTDIDQEDLEVFLQEAEEQLQLLDDDIVQLERQEDGNDLLQEIFRAIHTLKGSSAMIGHHRMASVAHVTENLLDLLRNGEASVTTPVIDALLHSLDALRLLKEELVTGRESDVEIDAVVSELDQASGGEAGRIGAVATMDAGAGLALDSSAAENLKSALGAGQSAFLVKVIFNPQTSWAAVRCFQVLDALALLSEVIASAPSQLEIEQEKVDSRLEAIVASPEDESSLRAAVATVPDIATLEVEPYFLSESQGGGGAKGAANGTADRKRDHASQTVRIDVERLDDLMDSVGELVIDRNRVTQIVAKLESKYKGDELVQDLGKTAAHIVKVVNELRTHVMDVRMLPIGTVFNGFTRMVRDLSQKFGKSLDFVIEGQDTEIDRTVVDRIRDPLVHLLRNAVDHGIESPEQRRAAGKSETGWIKLSAYHEQSHIVIVVEDDGGGIDPNKVREAAVKKGLISFEAASRLSDSEARDLIFLPGASTAETATEVSGRGVGMDIVRANIEAINGFFTLNSEVGKGSKFTLKLPLTLATLQSILVWVGNSLYAIPLVHVLETIKIKPGDIHTISGKDVIRRRGAVLPLLRLSEAFGLDAGLDIGKLENGRRQNVAGQDESPFAVVVQLGERMVGLAVDDVLEPQEIVVKSMGKYIGEIKGMAGASILGDGQVVLILDVPTLLNSFLFRNNANEDGDIHA